MPTLTFASIQFAEVISTGIPKPVQNASWFACKGNTLCSWCHHCNYLKFKSYWAGSLSFLPCPPSEQPFPPPLLQHKTSATGELGLGRDTQHLPLRKLAALFPSSFIKLHTALQDLAHHHQWRIGFTNTDFSFLFRVEQRLGTNIDVCI